MKKRSRGARPRLRRSAAVTGWDARGARHPRSGERYLGLGLCARDAHTGHVRSGDRPGAGVDARWTPLVFSSEAGGAAASLFWQAADGTGTAERLTQNRERPAPFGGSPDGTRVLFSEGRRDQHDVMMLTLDKDRRVQPLVQTPLPSATERSRPTVGGWRTSPTTRGSFRFRCGRFRT